MKKREAETQKHLFEHQFAEECKLFDLQGLLMNTEDSFTAAVEAFEIENKDLPIRSVKQAVFSEEEWLAKISISEALRVQLNLFVHVDGKETIHRYIVTRAGFVGKEPVQHQKISENDFVEWWRRHKTTIQTKEYRPQLSGSIKDSYFDVLLEKNGLKWGGNIDGFLILDQKTYRPTAIIENRFTEVASIYQYDPAKYYGQDVQTWKPLRVMCRDLNIPLILCTYSKRRNEEQLLGMAEILWQYDGIQYREQRPCDNLFDNTAKAKDWLLETVKKYAAL